MTSRRLLSFPGWRQGLAPLFLSDAISQLGNGISSFALMWWILNETGSVVMMGAVIALAFGTPAVCGPLLGPLVDRARSKRLVLLTADLLSGAAVALLGVLVSMCFGELWIYYSLTVLKEMCGIATVAARRALSVV